MHHLCPTCRGLFASRWVAVGSIDRKLIVIPEDCCLTLGKCKLEIHPSSLSLQDRFYDNSWLQAVEAPLNLGNNSHDLRFAPAAHHNLHDLERSATSGCRLCEMLWDSFPQHKLARYGSSGNTNQYLDTQLPDISSAVYFRYPSESKHECGPEIVFDVQYSLNGKWVWPLQCLSLMPIKGDVASDLYSSFPTSQKPEENAVARHSLELGTSVHDRSFDCVSMWILECLRNHPQCIRKRGVYQRQKVWEPPSRVIEISHDANSNAYTKLCETARLEKSVGSSLRYATLSHRWGSDDHGRLIRANYQEYLQNIPPDVLSNVFTDAIRIARRLGLRYIWIDAFCIVQDSKEDWSQEALRMSLIYSNAIVNIAATASKDGSGTLLPARNPSMPVACIIDASWKGLPSGNYRFDDDMRWARRIEHLPLNERAWVLQERLLAPRTLHLAQDQMWWECSRSRFCETSPFQSLPRRVPYQEDPVSKFIALASEAPKFDAEAWDWIVSKYSTCKLTKSDDKLIAFGGIAEAVSAFSGWPADDYVAGLWKPALRHHLLWFRNDPPASRSLHYRAPSWSWASIDGNVLTLSLGEAEEHEYAVKVLECQTITESSSPFDKVKSGYLRLLGHICRITITELKPDNAQHGHRVKFKFNNCFAPPASYFGLSLDDTRMYQDRDVKAFFLRFLTRKGLSFRHRHSLHSEGLILKRVDGKPGMYTRIGKLDYGHDEAAADIQVLLGDPELGSDDYCEKHDGGTYTIIVV